jgi:hypothetical protein
LPSTSEDFLQADLSAHDLVGRGVLQHAVLMDAALMGKRVRPTIALLYCTGNEVAADTSFEARVSMVVSILFHHGKRRCGR